MTRYTGWAACVEDSLHDRVQALVQAVPGDRLDQADVRPEGFIRLFQNRAPQVVLPDDSHPVRQAARADTRGRGGLTRGAGALNASLHFAAVPELNGPLRPGSAGSSARRSSIWSATRPDAPGLRVTRQAKTPGPLADSQDPPSAFVRRPLTPMHPVWIIGAIVPDSG